LSNGDLGAAVGNHTMANAGILNVPSQNDIALAFDPFATSGSTANAGNGNLDLASVFGDNSLANAINGDNFLAAVFGDGLTATATAPNPIDIVPSLGSSMAEAVPSLGSSLTDIVPSLLP
jgi:hypothetical protein